MRFNEFKFAGKLMGFDPRNPAFNPQITYLQNHSYTLMKTVFIKNS